MKISFITLAITVAILVLATGCVTSTYPDGTVTRSPDPAVWSDVVRIIATK